MPDLVAFLAALQAGGLVSFGDDVERLIPARKPGLAFTLTTTKPCDASSGQIFLMRKPPVS